MSKNSMIFRKGFFIQENKDIKQSYLFNEDK